MTAAGRARPAEPADQVERALILEQLDRNLLVEAAAGTGKTTSMVGRMVALLASGRCAAVRRLAAVTFTRKAAAELRGRFRAALARAAAAATGDEQRRRLEAASRQVDGCFIGTVHAFCARLLRERPVEAGVDPGFVELEEADDLALRRRAWRQLSADVGASRGAGDAATLGRLGLRADQLRGAFERGFADYPDIERWPAPPVTRPDPEPTVAALRDYAGRMRALAPRLPPAPAPGDGLAATYRRLPRMLDHYRCGGGVDPLLGDHARLMELLARLEPRSAAQAIQRDWRAAGGFTAEEVKEEIAAFEALREQHVAPQLAAWRAERYRVVIDLLERARAIYDRLRRERGALNYQDLLLAAARLLRGHPSVRRYFARRLTHLLIDEFQDTDPVQAEVALLLCADDPAERRWRRCRPRPGALFVVGDPKQSIYRFRRADIVTYNQVKRIITEAGGRVVQLSTNFRAAVEVIDWVNEAFAPAFPRGTATDESPTYVPLRPSPVAGELAGGALHGVATLTIPGDCSGTKAAVIEHEAARIAATIRHALDSGQTVARRQAGRATASAARPDDFMIVTRKRRDLSAYAAALAAAGVPHEVTGGCALNEVEALGLLHGCLCAVLDPDDPVALVATLRSELFGVSDAELYAFKRAGGRFSYRGGLAGLPPGLGEERARRGIGEALGKLTRYARWVDRSPPMVALAAIVDDLGLAALTAARPGGDQAAGSLGKGLELLRQRARRCYCLDELVDHLGGLVAREEAHDGVPAVGRRGPRVRVMNLHKVKGLEAPVVFLADPTGESRHEIALHVDRAGEQSRGFMAIYEPRGRFAPLLLAHPPGWTELAERERGFLEAEELRLRYVAATRAASLLVISDRATGEAASPWRAFPLDGLPELAPPPAIEHVAAEPKEGPPTLDEVAAAERVMTERFAHACRPGHVERRLVAAPRRRRRAAALLREAPVGQRALEADRRLEAIPYTVQVDGEQGPELIHGVVDLAFREAAGWVLVALRDGTPRSARVARQALNLRRAAEAWTAASSEPVSQRLLCALDGDDLCC